jgi:hypothetical protein
MSDTYAVTVEVRRPDGSVEQVRVGTATKTPSGFSVGFMPLNIQMSGSPSDYGSFSSAPARSSRPPADMGDGPTIFPPYGRSKGQPIAGATMNDLEFYANGCRRSLGDASKSRWHDKEKALLAVIEAEIARQRDGGGDGGGGGFGDDGIPPPGDEDAPF